MPTLFLRSEASLPRFLPWLRMTLDPTVILDADDDARLPAGNIPAAGSPVEVLSSGSTTVHKM